MSRSSTVDIDQLSRDERLELLERIWESLSREPDGIPLTDEQRVELENRLDRLDREGPVGVPWEQVRDEMTRS
ncbi:MAG TPA: addiction module protein [Polyangiales bacterium]|jgi:putative addiction module component (TIGR02574 family)